MNPYAPSQSKGIAIIIIIIILGLLGLGIATLGNSSAPQPPSGSAAQTPSTYQAPTAAEGNRLQMETFYLTDTPVPTR
jgi:hypothetical protein